MKGKRQTKGDAIVPADPKRKAAWERHEKLIKAAVARAASAFDERWEAAGRVIAASPPLYTYGGYKNTTDFFEHVLHESPRNAQRFIRVAKYASPEQEAKYGIHILDRALAFLEARTGKALGDKLAVSLDRIKIPVVRGGKERALGLDEVTVAEIEAATRKARHGKGGRREATKHARATLTALFAKRPGLHNVRISETRGLVSLVGIPIATWDAFKEAIASAHYDDMVGESTTARPRRGR